MSTVDLEQAESFEPGRNSADSGLVMQGAAALDDPSANAFLRNLQTPELPRDFQGISHDLELFDSTSTKQGRLLAQSESKAEARSESRESKPLQTEGEQGKIAASEKGDYWQNGVKGWELRDKKGNPKYSPFGPDVENVSQNQNGGADIKFSNGASVSQNAKGQISEAEYPDCSSYQIKYNGNDVSQITQTIDGKSETFTRGKDGKFYDEQGKPTGKDFQMDREGTLRIREGEVEKAKGLDGRDVEFKIESKFRPDGTKESETKTNANVQVSTTFAGDGKTPQKEEISLDGKKYRETAFTPDGKRNTAITFDNAGKKQTETKYDPNGNWRKSTSFEPDGKKLSETVYGEGHSSTTTSFDINGGAIWQSKHGNDGKLQSETRLQEGKPVSETTYDKEGMELHRTERKFDGDRLIKETQHRPDSTRTETDFGPDGKKTTESTYKFGQKESSTDFNADGIRTKETKYDAIWGHKTAEITYGPDGQTPKFEIRYNEIMGTKRAELRYHENGKLASQKDYWHDGVQNGEKQFRPDGTLESEIRNKVDGTPYWRGNYDASGKQLESQTRMQFDKSGKKISETTFNRDRCPISEIAFDPKTGIRTSEVKFHPGTGTKASEVKFTPDGKTPASETKFDKIGITRVSETKFQADGKTPASKTSFEESGEKPVNEVRFRPDGKTPLCETHFDVSGKPGSQTTFAEDGRTPIKEAKFLYKENPANPQDKSLQYTEVKDLKTGETQWLDAKGELARSRNKEGKEFAYHTDTRGQRVAVEEKRIEKFGQDYNIPEYRQEQLKKLSNDMAMAHSTPMSKADPKIGKVTTDPDDPNWKGVRKMTFNDYANFLDDLAGRKNLTESEKAFVLGQMVDELTKSQQYRETKEESSLKKWGRGTVDVEKPGKFVVSTEDAKSQTLREGNPGWSRHHIVDINRDGYHGAEVGWAKDEKAMTDAVYKHEVEHKNRGNLLRAGSALVTGGLDLINPFDWSGKGIGQAGQTLRQGGLDVGSTVASLQNGKAIMAYRQAQTNQMGAYAKEWRQRFVK